MPHLSGFTDTREVNEMMKNVSGTLAFDIGANGGFIANWLAHHFETVIACEPAEESYANLAHAMDNVKALNIAVSDHMGEVTLRATHHTESSGQLFTGNSLSHWGFTRAERTIPCVTLDYLAETYGTPDFVKIDTEGHEGKIIDGAHGVFETKPNFIIEIHDKEWGTKIEDYFFSIRLPCRVIRHSSYQPGHGPNYYNHYWLVSG